MQILWETQNGSSMAWHHCENPSGTFIFKSVNEAQLLLRILIKVSFIWC